VHACVRKRALARFIGGQADEWGRRVVAKQQRRGKGDPAAVGCVRARPAGGADRARHRHGRRATRSEARFPMRAGHSGTKPWTVSWLSLKTKVEPGLRGSQVMSGDWRRLHRVRKVCSGSPENHWVTRLSKKTEAEDSTRRCSHPGRSNRPGGAV
jgi:hypothetical protein